MVELIIPETVKAQVNHHFSAVYPDEGCGFLIGTSQTVTQFCPVENVKHSPVAYKMDPAGQIQVLMDAEDQGLQVLAIIHSHPNGPLALSKTDLQEATWHNLSYLIVSLADKHEPQWGGWFLTQTKHEEISIIFRKMFNMGNQSVSIGL